MQYPPNPYQQPPYQPPDQQFPNQYPGQAPLPYQQQPSYSQPPAPKHGALFYVMAVIFFPITILVLIIQGLSRNPRPVHGAPVYHHHRSHHHHSGLKDFNRSLRSVNRGLRSFNRMVPHAKSPYSAKWRRRGRNF